MSQAGALGRVVSSHKAVYWEAARAITYFLVALSLGVGFTIVTGLFKSEKTDPTVMFWIGVGLTALLCGVTLLWLIPALLRMGWSVDVHERGMVAKRGSTRRELEFAEFKSVDEDITFMHGLDEMTQVHVLAIYLNAGPSLKLADWAIDEFSHLRELILNGATRAMLPAIVERIVAGGSEKIGGVTFDRAGLAFKHFGQPEQRLKWIDVQDITIDPQMGNIVLIAAGDAQPVPWHVSTPNIFLARPLIITMQQRMKPKTK
jgi:hypothetical protein